MVCVYVRMHVLYFILYCCIVCIDVSHVLFELNACTTYVRTYVYCEWNATVVRMFVRTYMYVNGMLRMYVRTLYDVGFMMLDCYVCAYVHVYYVCTYVHVCEWNATYVRTYMYVNGMLRMYVRTLYDA